jgi:hypothetical protein
MCIPIQEGPVANTVGQTIEAYCGKCEVVAAHTITKVSSARISRVECDTCKDSHAYRKSHPKASGGATSDAQKAATARRKANKAEVAFESAMEHVDKTSAQPYGFSTQFSSDDIIDHPAFGLGRVVRTLAGNKIEVIFKDSSKVLVHGGH